MEAFSQLFRCEEDRACQYRRFSFLWSGLRCLITKAVFLPGVIWLEVHLKCDWIECGDNLAERQMEDMGVIWALSNRIWTFADVFWTFYHNGIVGVAGSNPVGSTTVKQRFPLGFQRLLAGRLRSYYFLVTLEHVICTCRDGR